MSTTTYKNSYRTLTIRERVEIQRRKELEKALARHGTKNGKSEAAILRSLQAIVEDKPVQLSLF